MPPKLTDAEKLALKPKPLDGPLIKTVETKPKAPKYRTPPAFLLLLDQLTTIDLPNHTARADKSGISIYAGAWTVECEGARTASAGYRFIGLIDVDGTPRGEPRKTPFDTLAEAAEYFESRLGKKAKKRNEDEE